MGRRPREHDPGRLARRCKEVCKKVGRCDVVFADYLQFMRPNEKQDGKEREVATVGRELKILAKELHCPVVVLAQLSRKVEERGPTAEPRKSDLHWSGSLEQDADIISFLWNKEVEPEGDQIRVGFRVDKQRNGPTGKLELIFDRPTQRFAQEDRWHSETP